MLLTRIISLTSFLCKIFDTHTTFLVTIIIIISNENETLYITAQTIGTINKDVPILMV